GGLRRHYERSSPGICHAGESLFSTLHTRSGSRPHLEGIGIGPSRTGRRRGGDVLYLRGIALDLRARVAPGATSPLNSTKSLPELFGAQGRKAMSRNDYGTKQVQ